MKKNFHDFNQDAKLPSKKETMFEMLMHMEEELGHFHNDYFERCLHDMIELNEFLRDREPLQVLESVALDFSPHDDYILLNSDGYSDGCYESFSKEQAIQYIISKKDYIIQDFLKNLDEQIAYYWDVYLEDDEVSTGGTAFAGETLIDFLLENFDYDAYRVNGIESYPFMTELKLSDLNEILRDCGIKPLKEDI